MSELYDISCEAALIGALLYGNKQIDTVADRISAEDFHEPLHGRMYQAIVREASLGKPANAVTIKPYLENDPALIALGGNKYLAMLSGEMSALLPAVGYADQIKMLAKRRRLSTALATASALAADFNVEDAEIISAADEALATLNDTSKGYTELSAIQCFDAMLNSMNEPKSGVTSGIIPEVDKLLGPLRKKQLVIAAGRPGMGKTAFAVSYSIGAAMNGHGVLFVTLEMSSEELIERAAADICFDGHGGVPYEAIQERKLTLPQQRSLDKSRQMFRDMPLSIVDAGHLTIGRLSMIVRRYARRMAAKGTPLELVVVDYLQLVSPDQRTGNRQEAVAEVSRGLKAIAKDNGVAVLALAQLSREVEKRDDKRPNLSDLKESGQIEQDADAVMFLLRDEYYVKLEEPADDGSIERHEWKEKLDACRGKIEFICAKRRAGRTGFAIGEFHAEYQAVR